MACMRYSQPPNAALDTIANRGNMPSGVRCCTPELHFKHLASVTIYRPVANAHSKHNRTVLGNNEDGPIVRNRST